MIYTRRKLLRDAATASLVARSATRPSEPARSSVARSGAISSGLATTQASQRPAVWCRSESTDSATRSSGAPTAATTIEMRGGA